MVEMLVATAIFATVMTIAVGALVTIIGENNRAQTIKSVIDNVTLAVDDMSRSLKEGTNYYCISGLPNELPTGSADVTCFAGNSDTGIMYLDPSTGTYTKYRFQSTAEITANGGATTTGNIQKTTGCNSNGLNCVGWQSITAPASSVNITNMYFAVYGDGGASMQPRVLITATGVIPATANNGTSTEFDIQTTASRRPR